MPLIDESSYRPPWGMLGGHLQTVFPAICRRVESVTGEVERLELEDGDFLDLEWLRRGRGRLAILSHGLEGSARAPYMQAMAAELDRQGWDVLAWNLRGCSGEANRLLPMYHSGATGDLGLVIAHALSVHEGAIDLLGFSLGGNLVLKYLGEQGERVNRRFRAAVTFSVPCDLACSSAQLARSINRIYMARFLRPLRAKIRAKHAQFPSRLSIEGIDQLRSFREFDDRYTAPLHGFRDAADYWQQSSCLPFLKKIALPTLIVNALNDPFLGPACYPVAEAKESDCVFLEMPRWGGHVGFPARGIASRYWSEWRAVEFLTAFG